MRLLVLSLMAVPAFADTQQATETYSRGFQQAKRVANLENGKDLPSRAYWLGTRVVKQSKAISFQAPKPAPKAKTKN